MSIKILGPCTPQQKRNYYNELVASSRDELYHPAPGIDKKRIHFNTRGRTLTRTQGDFNSVWAYASSMKNPG